MINIWVLYYVVANSDMVQTKILIRKYVVEIKEKISK